MRNAEQVVEQEYLQIRAKILEIAAFFDRLEANQNNVSSAGVAKLQMLRAGCELVLDADRDKAARVQLLFSCKFDEQWRQSLNV